MDILKEHPELAPDVLQILSQALKATQQQVHELLAERASEREESGTLNVEIALGGEDIALATGEVRAESQCCQTNLAQIAQLESDNNDIHHNLKDQLARNANLSEILKTAQTDLLSLNSKYDDEKSAGDQLRAVLESRYLDLRNQEAAVKAQNLAVAEEIKGLQRRKEEWARKELARGTQYDDMAKDRDALQATLNEKISALDAQEDALKRSIRERGGLSKDLEKTCLQLQHAKMRQAESDAAHAAVTRSFEAVQAENVKCKDDFQTLFNAFSLERQSRVQLQRTIEFKDAEAAQVRDDQDARLNTIVKQVRDDLLEQLNRQKAKCRQLGEERKDLLQKYTQREEDYSALDTVRETNMIKLRDENGNLRTTVHTVAARTREQLEQAVEHERGALEAMINNLKEENQQLKNDLNSVRVGSMERAFAATVAPAAVQTKPVEHTQVQIQPDTVARKLYIDLLSKFAPPRGRPPFRTLDSVDIVDTKNPLQPFAHKFPSNRDFLYCPGRTWCGEEMVHALVYHPTREYSSASGWTSPRILDLVGKKVDFFVTRGGLVYYAGVYQLHDLRAVNPPGAPIPADMSASAIRLATRVVQAATADLDTAEIIREGFAGGEIRTECFALQCVAFDDPMYDSLRLRRRLNGESDSKRKAEESGKDASQGRLVRPRSP